jgi:hypothetical protein
MIEGSGSGAGSVSRTNRSGSATLVPRVLLMQIFLFFSGVCCGESVGTGCCEWRRRRPASTTAGGVLAAPIRGQKRLPAELPVKGDFHKNSCWLQLTRKYFYRYETRVMVFLERNEDIRTSGPSSCWKWTFAAGALRRMFCVCASF